MVIVMSLVTLRPAMFGLTSRPHCCAYGGSWRTTPFRPKLVSSIFIAAARVWAFIKIATRPPSMRRSYPFLLAMMQYFVSVDQ
jgi:hypothetical protein